MVKKNTPILSQVVYIAGGIFIVACAVEVVWSGIKYLLDHSQTEE